MSVGRRTYHLSPDGEHIGYTLQRPDGLLMIVGRIARRADRYEVVNLRVVNPVGTQGPTDPSAQAWARVSALYELKSFVDRGRNILAFNEQFGVPPQVGVDLEGKAGKGPAPCSTARHGTTRHGTARHGTARHGTARHGTARHGTEQDKQEPLETATSQCVILR